MRDDSLLKGAVLEKDSQDGPAAVSVLHADLAWDSEVLLEDVNLTVCRGRHIAITGAVGSGKSLLLHAILGEVQPKAGNIHVTGVGMAYCGQTAWMENLSPHDNIFRWVPVDNSWHQRIIDACALREFMDSRARSDETIGTGGAKISGGEKQRLVRGFPHPSLCSGS